MKLRDLAGALGVQGRPREYPYDVTTFSLSREGEVRLARWLHPGERPKTITQESVDSLRTFLSEGDIAIDIGAHTGDSTLPMALATGASGLVFALEPNPYVFKVLEVNAGLNPGKTRIEPLMFAATPVDGQFDFEYSDAGYCNGGLHQGIRRWRHGHFQKLRVMGRNLAAYLHANAPDLIDRIRYVKIDTEGFDRAVVASMRDLLSAVRPCIKTEIYKHLSKDERRGYHADLRGLGYRVFKCEDDRIEGRELEASDMTRWAHFDVLALPR